MPGEYDGLKWPAKAKFTVELIHQHEENASGTSRETTWNQPDNYMYMQNIL